MKKFVFSLACLLLSIVLKECGGTDALVPHVSFEKREAKEMSAATEKINCSELGETVSVKTEPSEIEWAEDVRTETEAKEAVGTGTAEIQAEEEEKTAEGTDIAGTNKAEAELTETIRMQPDTDRTDTAQPTFRQATVQEKERCLRAINEERAKLGYVPLRLCGDFGAQEWADYLAENQVYVHSDTSYGEGCGGCDTPEEGGIGQCYTCLGLAADAGDGDYYGADGRIDIGMSYSNVTGSYFICIRTSR